MLSGVFIEIEMQQFYQKSSSCKKLNGFNGMITFTSFGDCQRGPHNLTQPLLMFPFKTGKQMMSN